MRITVDRPTDRPTTIDPTEWALYNQRAQRTHDEISGLPAPSVVEVRAIPLLDPNDALKIIEQLRRDKEELSRRLQESRQSTRDAVEQLAAVELNDDSSPLEQAIAGALTALNGQVAR